MKPLAVAVALLIASAPAQLPLPRAQKTAGFAAVSIRPVRSGFELYRSFTLDPAGLHAENLTLAGLIRFAYGIKSYQIGGGPKWSRRDLFDLDAATESPATNPEILRMLRAALAARFGLRLSHETRNTQVLDLVVAKGGPKLTELGADESPPPLRREARPGEILFRPATTITQLVAFLNRPGAQRSLRRLVLDRTGLTGRYNILLRMASSRVSRGGRTGFRLDFGDLPHALGRLGLKLQPATEPIAFYTITSAHQPTPN